VVVPTFVREATSGVLERRPSIIVPNVGDLDVVVVVVVSVGLVVTGDDGVVVMIGTGVGEIIGGGGGGD